jgi:ribulose-5-phosphate 4-epimerase/fuculose-1-phosphate aldolase
VPLYSAGLIGHLADIDIGYGNLSARTGGHGLFVVSGTQTGHLATLGNEHFSLVTGFDLGKNVVFSEGASEASSESMTHAILYELDPGIRAVVHVHSDALWMELKDRVPTTNKEAAYGTREMASEIARLVRDTDFPETGVAVMAGHEGGVISIGTSVREASERLLTLHRNH